MVPRERIELSLTGPQPIVLTFYTTLGIYGADGETRTLTSKIQVPKTCVSASFTTSAYQIKKNTSSVSPCLLMFMHFSILVRSGSEVPSTGTELFSPHPDTDIT